MLRIHDRVAHLAGQCRLQVGARHDAGVHEDLAERHAAVDLLLGQRLGQLRVGDQVQPEQGLADAHHRHPGLLLERKQQLVGRHDAAADEDVAELLVAQAILLLRGALDLLRGGRMLLDEHVAQARADVDAGVGLARHEGAAHGACVVERHEEEDAGSRLDMAQRAAFERAARGQRDAVVHARAVGEKAGVRLEGLRGGVQEGCSGGGWSGAVSVRRRNWEKRSAVATRAGGTCTWATPSAASRLMSLPLMTPPFSPSTSQRCGSTCGCGAG